MIIKWAKFLWLGRVQLLVLYAFWGVENLLMFSTRQINWKFKIEHDGFERYCGRHLGCDGRSKQLNDCLVVPDQNEWAKMPSIHPIMYDSKSFSNRVTCEWYIHIFSTCSSSFSLSLHFARFWEVTAKSTFRVHYFFPEWTHSQAIRSRRGRENRTCLVYVKFLCFWTGEKIYRKKI